MIDDNLSSQVQHLVDSATTIFIIFPSIASADHLAVAASLYLSLVRAQKSVGLVTTDTAAVLQNEGSTIIGLENTQQDLGNQNLSISFPYSPDQVDKVSYHVGEETNRFFLSIKPKTGFPPLDASNVEFSYTGASADLVFLIGVKDLESLEQLYFGYEQLYQDTPSISVNSYATSFGTVKIDSGSASSSSEVIAQLLPILSLPIESDTATNLLYGIESSTKNLSSPTTSAETFEAVAQLLRAGARRSFKRSSAEPHPKEAFKESIVHEVPESEATKRKNGKAKTPKLESSKKDSMLPPADFTPTKRI